MTLQLSIVAVTACVSGVAHTYMAAEKIEKMCTAKGMKIRVETQGALGIENKLSDDEIKSSNLAIIIADINIEGMERFDNCNVIKISTRLFLQSPEKVMKAIEDISLFSKGVKIHL
ncbi:PTS system, fructose-specific, IIB subunnit [Tolumonas auensis DSM 9187]|uniref:protein-N(pi)-phosphohistidine--D-fructose phosphotransferase n=1 Tax=Tolumonas auensis (strain DSM 9187 / NBRC 110442 / TA 4) TaxID=595494 RepID=C4LFY4_TOLAT|nr:PTS fructose transporter subunit IIB [Tolumonas auensis]ACQ93501.1 PTS system, fructose-specific, IIB subunnit [Tolumonas auensis DSM 9187]